MEINFKDQLIKLLKDPNYLAIMLGSCLIISSTTVFPTIMEQVLLPYHYPSTLCDTYGVVFNACGIGFGLVTMILLNKTHAFKTFTIVITVMTALSYILLQYSVGYHKPHWLTTIAICLCGGFGIASYSVVYEYTVEVTPGVGESLSCGILNMMLNVFSLICILIY